MGQKVNPTGFRLGYTKEWKSYTYVDPVNYAKMLEEDLKIRDFIAQKISNAGIVEVITKRFMNNTLVEISVARPGIVIGKGGSGIEKLKKDLEKLIKTKIEIKLFEVANPELSAQLIAENVAQQVSRRIVPKFAAQREIENAKNSGKVGGIRIWVSGRIKGAEIARIEKFQFGSLPLQTLKANIDYAYVKTAVPNAGIHGIKVWVFKRETNQE
ncbi:30S ribosomal protein S3 [Candidatus Dojkabacteria bacterium]|nr:30S ribosomal protein S3 [Candidatus Dojkabacteria bacterium]